MPERVSQSQARTMGESSRHLLVLPALERVAAWTTTGLTFRIPTMSDLVDGGESHPARDFSVACVQPRKYYRGPLSVHLGSQVDNCITEELKRESCGLATTSNKAEAE
jgi:hypothetical protein